MASSMVFTIVLGCFRSFEFSLKKSEFVPGVLFLCLVVAYECRF